MFLVPQDPRTDIAGTTQGFRRNYAKLRSSSQLSRLQLAVLPVTTAAETSTVEITLKIVHLACNVVGKIV